MNGITSQLLYYVMIFTAIAASLCIFNTMTGHEINWPLNITIALGIAIIWAGLGMLNARKKAKDAKSERLAVKHMGKAEKRAFKEAEAARYERIKQERAENELEYEDVVEVTIHEPKRNGKKGEVVSWTTSAENLAEAGKLAEQAEAKKVADSIKNMKPGKSAKSGKGKK